MKNKLKIIIDVTKPYLKSYSWKERDIKENKQIFAFLVMESIAVKKNKKCFYCKKKLKKVGVKGDIQTIVLQLKEFWNINYINYIERFKQFKIKAKNTFCSDKCLMKYLKNGN